MAFIVSSVMTIAGDWCQHRLGCTSNTDKKWPTPLQRTVAFSYLKNVTMSKVVAMRQFGARTRTRTRLNISTLRYCRSVRCKDKAQYFYPQILQVSSVQGQGSIFLPSDTACQFGARTRLNISTLRYRRSVRCKDKAQYFYPQILQVSSVQGQGSIFLPSDTAGQFGARTRLNISTLRYCRSVRCKDKAQYFYPQILQVSSVQGQGQGSIFLPSDTAGQFGARTRLHISTLRYCRSVRCKDKAPYFYPQILQVSSVQGQGSIFLPSDTAGQFGARTRLNISTLRYCRSVRCKDKAQYFYPQILQVSSVQGQGSIFLPSDTAGTVQGQGSIFLPSDTAGQFGARTRLNISTLRYCRYCARTRLHISTLRYCRSVRCKDKAQYFYPQILQVSSVQGQGSILLPSDTAGQFGARTRLNISTLRYCRSVRCKDKAQYFYPQILQVSSVQGQGSIFLPSDTAGQFGARTRLNISTLRYCRSVRCKDKAPYFYPQILQVSSVQGQGSIFLPSDTAGQFGARTRLNISTLRYCRSVRCKDKAQYFYPQILQVSSVQGQGSILLPSDTAGQFGARTRLNISTLRYCRSVRCKDKAQYFYPQILQVSSVQGQGSIFLPSDTAGTVCLCVDTVVLKMNKPLSHTTILFSAGGPG